MYIHIMFLHLLFKNTQVFKNQLIMKLFVYDNFIKLY